MEKLYPEGKASSFCKAYDKSSFHKIFRKYSEKIRCIFCYIFYNSKKKEKNGGTKDGYRNGKRSPEKIT